MGGSHTGVDSGRTVTTEKVGGDLATQVLGGRPEGRMQHGVHPGTGRLPGIWAKMKRKFGWIVAGSRRPRYLRRRVQVPKDRAGSPFYLAAVRLSRFPVAVSRG